jgi:trans-aconitate 2-methyltransferase
MADWNPNLYVKFEDERTRPARDLLDRVPLTDARAVADLGCGPGNSTELLVERFAKADVIGVDSSENMLTSARQRLPAREFIKADLSSWTPDRSFDLLFANATFQWVTNHSGALLRLFENQASGAVLAVQMPDNFNEPSHVQMRETAKAGRWASRLGDVGKVRETILTPEAYYDLFQPRAKRIDLWHTVYHHVLADASAIVEWVKSTGLRPYIDPLPDDERAEYLADYTARVAAAYPPRADGRVILHFPRLFMVMTRA